MSYLLSGGSRGLNPWIESTACQVITAPPTSSVTPGEAETETIDSNAAAKRKKARGPRIVQVLGRGGGWVDPATIPANHPQRTADRCLSCPPILVLSDGKNTVTAFVTPPPKGSQMAQNTTSTAYASNGQQLPSEEVSKICRRGTLIRIRDWRYTTMMLGGGRHYRHLTGTSSVASASVANTTTSSSPSTARSRSRPTMLSAVLPQNVPLTTPLALAVPWSSIEFIAGENGTVPIHHSHRLVDVNDSVEVRRILMDNKNAASSSTSSRSNGPNTGGGDSNGGIGPKNHLELSKRIRGWEEQFAAARLEMERNGNSHHGSSAGDDEIHAAGATRSTSGGVASLPPVRVSAAHTAAILAGRASSKRPATNASGSSDSNEDAKPKAVVKLGDPTKLLGTRNLSALLRTGMKGTDENIQNGQQQQPQHRQDEQDVSRRHQHGEQRGVRVGDTSRLLSSSAGRAALRESIKVTTTSTADTTTAAEAPPPTTTASQGAVTSDGRRHDAPPTSALTKAVASNDTGSDDDAGPAPFDNEDDNNDAVGIDQALTAAPAKATVNTAEGAIAAKKKSVALGDVRRLMASKQGRAALRSAISTMTIDGTRKSSAVAAPAAAVAHPVQVQPQAPPPSQKRRRGGVPRRSSQKPEGRASINEGPSSQNAAETKPTTPQETLAALQSLSTASLHSIFNQIMSSGVEVEDDVERDREEVPTPKKLSSMREEAAQKEEGSNGKDDEPLDLQFLLSDSEEVESSHEDGRVEERKKAASQGDDESEGEEESEPIFGIGDMLVPPTQEQQEDSESSRVEKAQGDGDEKPGRSGTEHSNNEFKSNSHQDEANEQSEMAESLDEGPRQQVAQEVPTGENMELEVESDEEALSQEMTQGSGENTAEGSPKRCPPVSKVKEVEEIDSDATIDENEASRKVPAAAAAAKSGEICETAESDSDTTAGKQELRPPISNTSRKEVTKAAPTKTAAPKVSSTQAVRPRALPPPPKSSRRLYTAHDSSSSSSDSDDWDTSTPMPRETEGNKSVARKRLRHLVIAPPSTKKPRPAPKEKKAAPAFSIHAMLARKKR